MAPRERAIARRWRRTSLALAVVALGAVASAAVLVTSTGAATNVADVRGSCASQYPGGLPVVTAHAEPTDKPKPGETLPTPPPGFMPVQGLWIDAPGQTFLTLSPFAVGFTVDRRACTTYKKKIDLGHEGLGEDRRAADVRRLDRGQGRRLRVEALPGDLTAGLTAERRARDTRLACNPLDDETDLVDVAPGPLLASLQRADDRVRRPNRMRSRMTVRRRVAAADMAAFEADPQMEPLAAHLQALLAAVHRLR